MWNRRAIAILAAVVIITLSGFRDASAGAESEGKRIIEHCKALYLDPRLDILRVRTAFDPQDLTSEHFLQDVLPSDAELAVFPIARSYSQQCRQLGREFMSRYMPTALPIAESLGFKTDLVWAALEKKQMTWTNANILRKQAFLEAYQQGTDALLAEEERARQRWAQAAAALDNAARSLGPRQGPAQTTTWCRWVGATFSCSQF